MVLRMPCPTKRTGSDNWYYRRRIPAKVRVALAAVPKAQRPPGWFKDHISISLRTADRAQAKAKCPQIAAEVEAAMAAILSGPSPLENKVISALSGELYGAFAEGLEREPVLTAEQWLRVAAMNEEARQGRYGAVAVLGIHKTAEERRRSSMEARFGEITDTFLARRGTITDAGSRWRLIERASIDLSEAAKKLARNADGDYEADDYKKRFPKFDEPRKPGEQNQSLTALLEAWHEAALNRMGKRDAGRMRDRTRKFITFLEHDSLHRVSPDDVTRWAEHRRKTASVVTVNGSDLASVKNLFNWIVKKKLLQVSPAAGVSAEGKRKQEVRERYFVQNEIAAILNGASAVRGTAKEAPKTTAAKRWVPWLCAYSGARVAEMVQLRKQDVRREPTGWVIRLTPEAGNIKNGAFRDVPVHEHLVAQGFIEFVSQSKDGPLFCSPREDGSVEGPVEGVRQRIRQFVRKLVADPNVQPNHAWRYTFKTLGHEAGIATLTLDAICGHAPKTQGDAYSRVTLKTRVAAMEAFPRYTTAKLCTDDVPPSEAADRCQTA